MVRTGYAQAWLTGPMVSSDLLREIGLAVGAVTPGVTAVFNFAPAIIRVPFAACLYVCMSTCRDLM